MIANTLVDTGAILALLDRSDHWHKLCVASLSQLELPLITSQAVLTELFHLVGSNKHEVEAAWRFLRTGVAMSPIDGSELPQVEALMSRYADRPMDFADATLVHLAQRDSLSTIFTVDHEDFETYRISGRRRFRIVPGTRP